MICRYIEDKVTNISRMRYQGLHLYKIFFMVDPRGREAPIKIAVIKILIGFIARILRFQNSVFK